ncbi:sensor histidine kinase [candidate division KSB1 bacterium]
MSTDNFYINILIYFIVIGAYYLQDFYRKLRDQEVKELRLENQLAAARLEILKIQLHPHFLFNTLNTISALIPEEPDAADNMIDNLSELLRISLNSSKKQKVTLDEELKMLRIYLDIEERRFRDRLKININVDPNLLGVIVPNLLLQPLVENAIRHGISTKAEGGKIEINAKKIDERLLLEIIDDGSGLKDSQTTIINEGFGLKNTRERLKQLYGENFRFDIRNSDTAGCIVSIEIPYLKTDEEKKKNEGMNEN